MSDLYEPFLHQSVGIGRDDAGTQLHNLVLSRLHGNDLLLRGEGQLGDALEALLEMGLDPQGVLGLGQDFKELIIGQEEKSVAKMSCKDNEKG